MGVHRYRQKLCLQEDDVQGKETEPMKQICSWDSKKQSSLKIGSRDRKAY